MCGIAGKLYFNNEQVAENDLVKMGAAIRHRGPDSAGTVVNGRWGFAFQRLAIIDTSQAGNQPMADADKKVWIVFNGEIYNFQELRAELERDGVRFRSKTDTETIIYAYKKYGVECVHKLRGMFAFALWDENKKQLFIARDRVGKKPLKYYYDNKVFIFASELKAILTQKEVRKEPDFEAIDEYLTYQYVPHPKTGFVNIWKLPPATYLIIQSDGAREEKRYWRLNYTQKKDHSETEWQKIITEKLRESVRMRLISDVPLGAHLSGGIDSSLITALMAREMNEPVKTFSIGFKENAYNELPYARMVAKKYNTDHHEYIVEPKALDILPQLVYHYEEPYADSSALPTWYLSQLTKHTVTVALNGDGGDENCAGYERYAAMQFFNRLRCLPAKPLWAEISKALYGITGADLFKNAHRWFTAYNANPDIFFRNIVSYLSQKDKQQIYTPALKDKTAHSRWESFLRENFREAQTDNWLNRLLSTDVNTYLPNDLLVKVDIAGMAHSLEVRSPFLDHEFMELAAGMPARLKMNGMNKKYLLKKIAEQYIPYECIYRKKHGFSVPLTPWFKKELGNYLEKFLNKKYMHRYGINPAGIQMMLNAHRAGAENYGNRLWAILCLCQWFETWFE